ncbi:hypothetical protein tb265_13060 [Gemmatimonadetes bacterium T265]|nr:hypothetical protein tb265_13060 [Gemmatimonadetes bacterium T265]
MSHASTPLTVYELRRLGSDYLWRANEALEHARRGGQGGGAYTPVPETAAEHAGQYVLSEGSLRGALAALDYQLAHLDPGENGPLWREARAILAAAAAHAAPHPAPSGSPHSGPPG